jgi:hypothetical protein
MSTATIADSADFDAAESLLDEQPRTFLHNVRDFRKAEVEPTINRHWKIATHRAERGDHPQ